MSMQFKFTLYDVHSKIIHSYRRSPLSSHNKCEPYVRPKMGPTPPMREGRTPRIKVNNFLWPIWLSVITYYMLLYDKLNSQVFQQARLVLYKTFLQLKDQCISNANLECKWCKCVYKIKICICCTSFWIQYLQIHLMVYATMTFNNRCLTVLVLPSMLQ